MRKKVFIALKMSGIAGQDKLSGIFRFLGEDRSWDITLIRTAAELSPDRMKSALREDYDGFIVSIPEAKYAVTLLASSEVPTIVMDIYDPVLSARKRNIAFIHNSAEEIGRLAANHILSIGTCRSYAFVHAPSRMAWSVNRCKSFREALKENGFWCHEFNDPEGLQKLKRPVGIFTANDDRGYDVIAFCHAHKMRIPEDAAVLGIDNDTLICENCQPKLSSIQPDFEQEGCLAAEILAKMMNARGRGRSPSPPPQDSRTFLVGVKALVRRESTNETSLSGKLVQKALSYINANALNGISVEDVVRHLKVSRRLADLRFRELQGTTIGETIIASRLAEVKRLLRATKEPIDTIAAQCGYTNPNYLKNLFKKRFAMSMSAFRTRST